MLWEGFRLLIEPQGEVCLCFWQEIIKKAMRSYEDSTDGPGFESTSLPGLFRAVSLFSLCLHG